MLVYGIRMRRRGPAGHPVRAGTVDKALAAIGKGISNLGELDPRKELHSAKYHPLYGSFLKAMHDEDSPDTRAYPVNLLILRELRDILDTDDDEYGVVNQHVIDLIIVAFYWLLRPAEYCDTGTVEARSQAFLFRHITLTIDGVTYPAPRAPLNDPNVTRRVSHATLELYDQKNSTRG